MPRYRHFERGPLSYALETGWLAVSESDPMLSIMA
jgi:hypothetical protein